MLNRSLIFIILCASFLSEAKTVNANIYDLISNGKDFHKKNVKVNGYIVKYSSRMYFIFPYKEDAYIKDLSRSIDVDSFGVDLSMCEGGYVTLDGTFFKLENGRGGVISSLKSALKISKNGNYDNCMSN